MMKLLYQIWVLTDALKWKHNFSSRTNAFNEYIKEQNATEYKKLNIEIIAEREGLWLEFLLKEEEQMFEELIAERREAIFKSPNNEAQIDQMKLILNDYNKDK